jgi:DNA gyrase subunit A
MGMNTKDEDFVTNLFVANTHTALLFFTSDGMVYKLKTWRLPLGGRNARGKAIVNLLPIQQGVSIAAIMPIDAAEEDWKDLQIVFANSEGGVRRNALSDFTNVKSNGKIAMKLPENVTIVGVKIATEDDDFLLTTSMGKAIRFPTTDVRVFKGRDSTGVRGVKLAKDDYVVSMAVIRHVSASADERNAYFKMRRALTGEEGSDVETSEIDLSQERYDELAALEQWILTITRGGFGKRSSAHEYRVSGRGGQGVAAANLDRRDDRIIACFTVEEEDQIMLATSTGQSIRCPVSGISRQGRTSSGVTVFSLGKKEEVVSVAYIAETSDEDDASEADATEE